MTLGEDLCSEVMGSVSRDNPSACINVNLKGYEGRFFKNAVTAKRWIDGAVTKLAYSTLHNQQTITAHTDSVFIR